MDIIAITVTENVTEPDVGIKIKIDKIMLVFDLKED